MGIAPAYWGPHVWAAIHLICLGAPESFSGSDSSGYRAFFTHLASILPCDACREHLRANLKETSIEAALSGGRESLFQWSVQLHNTVNGQLGKPIIPYEQAKAFWTDVANGKKPCPSVSDINATNSATKNKKEKDVLMDYLWIMIWVTVGFVAALILTSRGRRKS
jgi:hypothetical protein